MLSFSADSTMGNPDLSTVTMFSEERRLRILELIRQRKKLTVHELCQLLQVSPATVRGDLRDLDRDGLLVRTHGGALEKSRAGFEQVSIQRSTENLAAKQAIAAEAPAGGGWRYGPAGYRNHHVGAGPASACEPRSDGGDQRSGDRTGVGGSRGSASRAAGRHACARATTARWGPPECGWLRSCESTRRSWPPTV